MEKENFLKEFFNVEKITFNSKKINKLYEQIQKYIYFNVFNKFNNLKEILYEYYFLDEKDNWNSIYLKIAGYIGGKRLKETGGRLGISSWNKGKKLNFIPWNSGLTKNDDKRLLKLSQDRMGDNNPSSYKNRPDRSDANRKQSKTVKEKILNGSFTPKTENRLTHKKLIYDNIKFRSSWEVIFYYLHKKDNYLYESLRIKYWFNNKFHIYITDFYDPQTNTIYEIKPDNLFYNIQKEKYKTIINTCIKLGYNYIHLGDTWKNSISKNSIIELKETEAYKLFKAKN